MMLERLIYRVLDAGRAHINEDPSFLVEYFEDQGLARDEAESIRDYWLSQDQFYKRSLDNTAYEQITGVNIVHQYPRTGDTPQFPCWAIVLESEQEGGDKERFLGDIVGDAWDPVRGWVEMDGSVELKRYAIYTYADNPDVCVYYHELLGFFLRRCRDLLKANLEDGGGQVLDTAFSGGDMGPDPRYGPEHLFVRRFGLELKVAEAVEKDKQPRRGSSVAVSVTSIPELSLSVRCDSDGAVSPLSALVFSISGASGGGVDYVRTKVTVQTAQGPCVAYGEGRSRLGYELRHSAGRLELRASHPWETGQVITVQVFDLSGASAICEQALTDVATVDDTRRPQVADLGGSVIEVGGPVAFLVADAGSGVDWDSLRVRAELPSGGALIAAGAAAQPGYALSVEDGTVSLSRAAGWSEGASFTITLAVSDLAGNKVSHQRSLEVAAPDDAAAPIIERVSAAAQDSDRAFVFSVVDDASGVDWARLSASLEVAGIREAAILDGQAQAGYSMAQSGGQVTLARTEVLPEAATVSLLVTAFDVVGNKATRAFDVAISDRTPPQLENRTPAVLAADGALLFSVSDAGAGVSLDSIGVSVQLGAGAPELGVVGGQAGQGYSFSVSGGQARLTRAEPWPYSTEVTATITAADRASNAQTFTLHTVVESVPDNDAPTITDIGAAELPRAGAELVFSVEDLGSGVDWSALSVTLSVQGSIEVCAAGGQARPGYQLARAGHVVQLSRESAFVGGEACMLTVYASDLAKNEAEHSRALIVASVPAPRLDLSQISDTLAPEAPLVIAATGEAIDWSSLEVAIGGAAVVSAGAAGAGYTLSQEGDAARLSAAGAGWPTGPLVVAVQLSSLGGGQTATATRSVEVASGDPIFGRDWDWFFVHDRATLGGDSAPWDHWEGQLAGGGRLAVPGSFDGPGQAPVSPWPSGFAGRSVIAGPSVSGFELQDAATVRVLFRAMASTIRGRILELENFNGSGVDYFLHLRFISGDRLTAYRNGLSSGSQQASAKTILPYVPGSWALVDLVVRPQADGSRRAAAMINGTEVSSATEISQTSSPARNGGRFRLAIGSDTLENNATIRPEIAFLGGSNTLVELDRHRADAAALGLYVP